MAAREGGENGRGRGMRRYEDEEEDGEEEEEGEGERVEGRDGREVREMEGRDGREGRGGEGGGVVGRMKYSVAAARARLDILAFLRVVFVDPHFAETDILPFSSSDITIRRSPRPAAAVPPRGARFRWPQWKWSARRRRATGGAAESVAGGAARGGWAKRALSDESMRRLRYCLSWLQYATQHIDAQILILRDSIASLHPHPPPGSSLAISTDAPEPELTPDHLRTLAHLRSDIVHTIRQVVGVVSKYAGGALLEPARGRVRGFILDLPKRFSAESSGSGGMSPGAAGAASATGVAAAAGSGGASRRGAGVAGSTRGRRGAGVGVGGARAVGSPHAHLRPLHPHAHSRRGSVQGGVEPGKALAAAQKVLVLATESLDMMRGVPAVVADSLDRADAWVDRLRTVGIQCGMDGLALPDGSGEHGHWAGATPAWTAGAPRSPGGYTSTSGTRSHAYGSDTRYASGARSPTTMRPQIDAARLSHACAWGEEERELERDEGRMEVDG
ncbi:transcription factor Opi1-domain-containing protein [Mycena albidolilacea]|uniref:Transcription factor Opi1-domain-containing protein n=1 Tax=Mycena albidolilacea TaxID=1033008 RepID=A0AAD6ZKG1_9AGAR|nr:transcription factor Opi1-domain-containing protein [Mycena albidolilacea]